MTDKETLNMMKENLENVADILYKDATVYLNRKYNIYISDFAALKSGKNGKS